MVFLGGLSQNPQVMARVRQSLNKYMNALYMYQLAIHQHKFS